MDADGPEVRFVVEAARDLDGFTYLGIAGRGSGDARGTVFATLLAVDLRRGMVSHRRKLVPCIRSGSSGSQATASGCASTKLATCASWV